MVIGGVCLLGGDVCMDQGSTRRPLTSLQIATVLSWFGDAMSGLALPWFVLQVTGSVSLTGVSVAARTIGVYVASILAGPYTDRWSPHRVATICYGVAAGATGAIPLLWTLDVLTPWALTGLVLVSSASQRSGFLALQRILPELAHHAGVTVERATGMNEILYQTSLLAGPPLAGLLIALVGSSWVLLLDAATFAIAIVLVTSGIPRSLGLTEASTAPAASWSFRSRLAEGFAFLKQDRLLLALVGTVSSGILLVNAPLLAVILPVYARETLDSAVQLGILIGCFAGGALAGATLFTAWGERVSRRRLWITSYGVGVLPYLALILDLPLVALALALAAFGLGEGLSTPLYAAIRYRRVPRDLRGRVFGAPSPVTGLAPTLGVLIAAVLLESFGIRAAAGVLVAGSAVLCVWLVTSPEIRYLDTSGP
jgi:MFS family permease